MANNCKHFKADLMPGDDDKFVTITLPDVTKVDPSIITKFSTNPNTPDWRTVGVCRNKKEKCVARGKKVWINLGYGTFHMSMEVCQAKCPMCKKPTKGNKLIGLYQCQMTGRGMKVKQNRNDNNDETDTEDEAQKSTQNTEAGAEELVGGANADEKVEEQFSKFICDTKDGFMKMNGVNGPLVQWRYMTLEIKKLEQK